MERIFWESIIGKDAQRYLDRYDEARKYLETSQSYIWTILASKDITYKRALDITIETAKDAKERAIKINKESPYKGGARRAYMDNKVRAFRRLERILRSARAKERNKKRETRTE